MCIIVILINYMKRDVLEVELRVFFLGVLNIVSIMLCIFFSDFFRIFKC